ncbi:MAG: polyprenyl synthetase family protein, partial [Pseudomonadota bacterium]|nr:polyprenyl synthetase family protein [Pseudomonadota bacterium]
AIGDDFREGKLTAPVILALESADDDERAFWARTMSDLDQSEEDLARAIEILNKYNALERGLDIAKDFANKAQAALDKIDGQDALRQIMKELALYTVYREA